MSKISFIAILLLIGLFNPINGFLFQFGGSGRGSGGGKASGGGSGQVSGGGQASGGGSGNANAGAHLNLHINLKMGFVGQFLALAEGVFKAFSEILNSLGNVAGGSVKLLIETFVQSGGAAFDALRDVTINTVAELQQLLSKFSGLLAATIKNGRKLIQDLFADGEIVLGSNVNVVLGLLQALFDLTNAFSVHVNGGFDGNGGASGSGNGTGNVRGGGSFSWGIGGRTTRRRRPTTIATDEE